MKFKTEIESLIPKKPPKSKLLTTIIIISNLVLKTVVPFIIGFYYGQSGHLAFFIIFIILLFIDIRLETKQDYVNLKIIRGI